MTDMKILILYSTIYGHNLEMGKFIYQHLFMPVDTAGIGEFDPKRLADYDLVIICPCTYSEGYLQPTDEAFINGLKNIQLPNLKFLIVGAGDRTFGPSCFARAVDIFSYQLKQCGAQPMHAPIKYDFAELLKTEKKVASLLTKLQPVGSANID